MGVYIKGKRKPGTCYDCDFVDGSDDCFFGLGYTGDMCDCVYEDCPLIEVIEPHGRLIDAGKLDAYKLPSEKQDFKTWHKHSAEYKYAVPVFNSALDMVKNNAPTVIEAEGE